MFVPAANTPRLCRMRARSVVLGKGLMLPTHATWRHSSSLCPARHANGMRRSGGQRGSDAPKRVNARASLCHASPAGTSQTRMIEANTPPRGSGVSEPRYPVRLRCHPMSPQDDVNRLDTLATRSNQGQQNFALDSDGARTESRAVTKMPQWGVSPTGIRQGGAPAGARRLAFRTGLFGPSQPSARTRADRRETFRDAVFLW